MKSCQRLFFTALFLLPTAAYSADVKVVKQPEGWQLRVDGEPYVVRGIAYSADKVGEDPNIGNYRDWMEVDDDSDGRIDAPYQSWVDKNRNNRRDADEPEVGDFQLLAEMGVNTIRLYHHPSANSDVQALYPPNQQGDLLYNHAPNKALLRELFTRYGIRVAMGDEIGAYAVGSGAAWVPGTDYRDPKQLENIRTSVKDMVAEFKDEPFLLLWVLGNENNYPFTHTNAHAYPKEYAQFVNEIARLIHQLDPHHPVALANGETQFIRTYAQYTPDIDIFGLNIYRRPGFGFLWKDVASNYGKPVLLTEFGVSSPRIERGVFDEDYQTAELLRNWCDIENHTFGKQAPGNALGGFIYAWLDNWWQDGNPHALFLESGKPNHEALGIAGQGDGRHSPLIRQLRKSYAAFRALWKSGNKSCDSL